MKRAVWVGLALFLLALIGVPNARADSYKPAFTHSDSRSDRVAAIAHFSFDETADARHEGAHRFGRGSHRGAVAPADDGTGNTDGNQGGDQGTITSPPTDSGTGMGSAGSPAPTTATPEPGTFVLMLLGVGLLFLSWKRVVPGLPRIPE